MHVLILHIITNLIQNFVLLNAVKLIDIMQKMAIFVIIHALIFQEIINMKKWTTL